MGDNLPKPPILVNICACPLYFFPADFQNAYSYDGFGRESQVTQSGASGGNAVADKLVAFSYNADGQYSEIDRYDDLTGSSGDLVATSVYGYDSIGRLTSLDQGNSSSSTEFAGYSWAYNADSLVSTAGNSVYTTEDAAYSYDHDGQLTAANYSGDSPLDQSFAYDANGNQSGDTMASGGASTGNNQITDDGTWTYTYDADGNLTKQVGDSGGAQAGNEIDYAYDVGNRLIEVKNLTDDVVTQDVQYTYDMFGNLIGRKFTPYTDGVAGTPTVGRFVFDPTSGQMVLAFDGSGNLTDRFLNGPAVDQILADENYSSPSASPSTAGNTLWMLTDNQGTVRDIVTSSGLADHLTYDAFGKLINQSGSGAYASTDVVFGGYTGTFTDLATGMQWHNDPSSGYTGRWYNPSLQRWMGEDPSGLGSDLNPYRYAGNDPASRLDASGCDSVIGAFFGGAWYGLCKMGQGPTKLVRLVGIKSELLDKRDKELDDLGHQLGLPTWATGATSAASTAKGAAGVGLMINTATQLEYRQWLYKGIVIGWTFTFDFF